MGKGKSRILSPVYFPVLYKCKFMAPLVLALCIPIIRQSLRVNGYALCLVFHLYISLTILKLNLKAQVEVMKI